MKSIFRWTSSLAVALSLVLSGFAGPVQAQSWVSGADSGEYNEGPDPSTAFGRSIIDLYANLPEYMSMSDSLMEAQKFRFIFGLMLTRTYFTRNSTKIFFIGQDATHIAEAAKQPGTSGFGARVQSIGNFFGVDEGVSTSNAFLSTIKGQYGAFDHVYIEMDKDGKPQIRQAGYVDNELWMLANGADSEIRKKREEFWESMIKNNPESLRLMVLFGGAARDAFAEFLIARGAKVPTRLNPERLKSIQVPETKLVFAGGNNEFPVPIDRDGRDIYEVLMGRKLDYSKKADQEAAVAALKAAGQRGIDMMVFTGGGVEGSGIVNAAQLGGYDLSGVEINGKKTVSLKGLRLSDGTVIEEDIGFALSVHPTVLSGMKPEDASRALRKSFEELEQLKEAGWYIEPDKGWVNRWHKGEAYEYGRADIRPGYFEFGAPDGRRVSRADASRLDPQTIIAGSRARERFDQRLISLAKESKPSEEKDPNDLWSVRPRQSDTRYVFDRGPGKDFARRWMATLDRETIFAAKPGMQVKDRRGNDVTFETHGIDAFNTKTAPAEGFFGLHRGSFDGSRVLILADPHGVDDWNTSRALTGARGQYLNGLMRDIGVGEDYLIVKTAPFGMDGATAEEWEQVRRQTENYREVAIAEALSRSSIEMIMTDGEIAKAEMERILKKRGIKNIRVVNIQRDGMDPASGIAEAGDQIKALGGEFANATISGKMADIPRSHLTWWSRIWEGTGGDTTISSLGKGRGKVFAIITPNWVVRQKVRPLASTLESIRRIRQTLTDWGIRVGKESLKEFLAKNKIVESGLVKKKPVENRLRSIEVSNGLTAPSVQGRGPMTCPLLFGAK